MKSKLLVILTCVLRMLSELKREVITPKKEERKKQVSSRNTASMFAK